MFALLRKTVDRLIDLSALLSALALLAVMGVVVVDVIGRYFGAPLYGAQDMVEMASVILIFGAMAQCDRQGRHVAVDLLEPYFAKSVNRSLTVFGNALGAVIFALVAWYVWESSKLSIMLNMATNILQIPRAPFQYAISAFAALTALAMALRVLDHLFGDGADPHERRGP